MLPVIRSGRSDTGGTGECPVSSAIIAFGGRGWQEVEREPGSVSGGGCWKIILKTCHTVGVYVILKKKRGRRAMK